jgi:hypothetical protein
MIRDKYVIQPTDELGRGAINTDSTGLFGRQHIRPSLIALGAKERVFFHPSVNRVRRNSRQHHACMALWTGRRRGFCIWLKH